MSGRPHRTQEQIDELARQVALGRRGGTPWKVLERVYGTSRIQLWRYAKSQLARQMQQQSSK